MEDGKVREALRRVLGDVGRFSRFVLGVRLRGYQAEPLREIVDSILRKEGREFLLVFPRQAGKNEAVAQLLAYLLVLLQGRGGNVVFAAIGDGVGRGMRRLEEHLENPLTRGRWGRQRRPEARVLGKAAVVFLSSHPSAKARGETAHHLLIIDEAQDQYSHHVEAVFTPMRAANNATAVYMGTVRTTSDFLWRKKLELERLEEGDGVRRVYLVSPEEVVAENGDYGRFLAGQIAKYGERHPIVQAEYFLRPMDREGGLFPEERRRLMRGVHYRRMGRLEIGDWERAEEQRSRGAEERMVNGEGLTVNGQLESGRLYVAAVDVAGQDEGASGEWQVAGGKWQVAGEELVNPGRDWTVATVFEVREGAGSIGPGYWAVDVFVDHGGRHFQEVGGRPSLAARLLGFLRHWEVSGVIVDASGVGQGLADWLMAEMGKQRVIAYHFAGRGQKAMLGSRFLSLIETNRFKYWCGDEHEVGSDGWWFWEQAARCSYHLAPRGLFERDLQWGVGENQMVETPLGRVRVHDDRLMSAALIAEYDFLARQGRVMMGMARSEMVRPVDPLELESKGDGLGSSSSRRS